MIFFNRHFFEYTVDDTCVLMLVDLFRLSHLGTTWWGKQRALTSLVVPFDHYTQSMATRPNQEACKHCITALQQPQHYLFASNIRTKCFDCRSGIQYTFTTRETQVSDTP